MSLVESKWSESPTPTRPISADEALLILSDFRRLLMDGEQSSEVGEQWHLSRHLQLDEFLIELDELIDEEDRTHPDAAKALLDSIFCSNLPTSELDPLLNSPKKATLGDLCDRIAIHARIEVVAPANIAGMQSWEAGVFRILRQALRKADTDVSGLRPSSLLEPYLWRHRQVFEQLIRRIAPGRLSSQITCEYPIWVVVCRIVLGVIGTGTALVMVAALGFVLLELIVRLFGGQVSSSSWMATTVPLALVTALVVAFLGWLVSFAPPKSMHFGDFKTFRDLCSALAVHYRDRRSANPQSSRSSSPIQL